MVPEISTGTFTIVYKDEGRETNKMQLIWFLLSN